MNPIRLILVLSCIFQYAFSQNLKTPEGLKTGLWIEDHDWDEGMGKRFAYYKVVSFDQLKIVDTILAPFFYGINQNGREKVVIADGAEGNLLSVRDSLWRFVYPNGVVENESLWDKGQMIWSRSYDKKGNLLEFEENNNDTHYIYTYEDGRFYSKETDVGNLKTVIYYPNDQLEIPYSRLYFSNLVATTGNFKINESINIRARKDLSIISIKAASKRIKHKLTQNQFPIQLKADSSLKIAFELTSSPASLTKSDSITIITAEPEQQEYIIPCIIEAAHINNTFMIFAKPTDKEKITLSKSKDKYLVVSEVEKIVIKKNKKAIKTYTQIFGMTKIDLSKWKEGVYEVEVSKWGNFKQLIELVIIK